MLTDIFSFSITMVKIFFPVFFQFLLRYKNIEIEQQSPRNPTQIMPNSCEIIYAGWRREMMGQWRLRRRRRRRRLRRQKDSRGGGEDGNSPDAASIFFSF